MRAAAKWMAMWWAAGASVNAQLINEINVHPAGGVNRNSMFVVPPCSAEMTAEEWVEIYNPSPCRSLDLSCYILGANMGAPENVRLCSDADGAAIEGDNEGYFVFPPGTVVPPLGFLTVGGKDVFDFNTRQFRGTYYCGGPRWFLNSRTGWLGLFDPEGNVVDAVFWTEFGEDEIYSAEQLNRSGRADCACSATAVTIPSARDLYPQSIRFLGLTVPTPNFYSDADLGKFYREPDGGCWRILHPGTPGACNTQCNDGAFARMNPSGGFFCESTVLTADDVRPCNPVQADFAWLVPGQAPATGTRFSFSGLTGDTLSVILTATLPDGCVDSVQTTFYRRNARLEIQPSRLTLCPGETARFNVRGPTSEAEWQWTAPGLEFQRQGSELSATVLNAGQYRLALRLRYPDGCVSDSVFADVTVQSAPPAVILNFKPEICAGESVMLRAETVAGARVRWDFDGGLADDSLGYGGVNVRWNDAGEKTVRIFVSHPDYPCASRDAETKIVVRPAPDAPTARLVPASQSSCGYAVVGVRPPPPGTTHILDFDGATTTADSTRGDEI
ncbi:MAG: lamin tail domain-containing protein, partial [Bacteroidia bacterium]|nr:lamin tail domain-containing protein [Bacteroidia bacterium]MDW8334461.1 lamin tail domain-containing protein [Bacteroidia bacterium]